MSPIRVTVLTTSFPLCEGASSGIFVARLVDHLPRHVSTRVLVPNAPCGKEQPPVHPELHTFRYAPNRLERLAHGPGGIPVALRNSPALYLLIPSFIMGMFFGTIRAARDADVIHANWTICGSVAGLAGRLLGVPVITTVRGEDIARVQSSAAYRYFLALAVKFSAVVVTVSDAIRRDLSTLFPDRSDTFQTVANGVDEAFFEVGRHRIPKRESEPLRLITVGSLIPRKGIERIIAAVANAATSTPITLNIVGSGPEQTSLESQVKNAGLRDRVRFLGPVTPTRVPELLARADAFVLASRSEGRPNVVLEAMAAGLPVIASNISGVDEIIKHEETGLLFSPDKTGELAQHIARLQQDAKLRARLGNKARAYLFEQDLLWSVTGERYAMLYQKALEAIGARA